MVSIEQRQAWRTAIMHAVYDETNGDEFSIIEIGSIGTALEMPTAEITNAAKYLEGEGLIKAIWTLGGSPPAVSITHRGIREVEESRAAPTRPTQHFTPYVNVITIHGDVTDSIVQAGSQNTAVGTFNESEISALTDLVAALQPAFESFPDSTERAEALSEVATIRAQLSSPKPKRAIVRASLVTLYALGTSATGTLIAPELAKAIHHFL
jgi:hypothetical protein